MYAHHTPEGGELVEITASSRFADGECRTRPLVVTSTMFTDIALDLL
jgi:hypothetical protein